MDEYLFETCILSENQAKEICEWKYEGKYSIYNFSDWSIVVENGWDLSIREKREQEYIGILLNNELIAYGRIFTEVDNIFLGIGLKPSFCGKGLGSPTMLKLIEIAKMRYPGKKIMVEVRDFNQRAKKCYESIGFVVIDYYWKDTISGGDHFYLMTYQV